MTHREDWEKEKLIFSRNNHDCRDCEHAIIKSRDNLFLPNLYFCEAYEEKPFDVLDKDAKCDRFKKKTSTPTTFQELIDRI